MHGSFSTVIAHMEPPSSRNRQKGFVWAPKGPFWSPGGPRRVQGEQIWSQLPLIGPPGLNSWSTLTLSWYWAPFGPKGALKGLVLAPKGPFRVPRGPKGVILAQSLNFYVPIFWGILFVSNIGLWGVQSVAAECLAHSALF